MRSGQKLVAQDGYEVMLFPLEYMYMSQGEGGSGSHANTYSMDFLGWGRNGRIYRCPVYAPCSCKCVNVNWSPSSGSRVFQSLDKVHCPDGYFGIITFNTVHDNSPLSSLNQVFQQGDLIAHTGTAGNVTGDHLHFNTASGVYDGFYNVGTGHYQLKNSTHIYDTCFVNDTDIRYGMGYNWQIYNGGITPSYKKYKFKWVLYANKLRERSNNYDINL